MNLSKSRKSVYIAGCALLGVTVLLAVYFILLAAGVIHGKQQIIIVQAGSAEKMYDGTPLTCSDYEIIKGNVGLGHTMSIYTVGEQTEPGCKENALTEAPLPEKSTKDKRVLLFAY